MQVRFLVLGMLPAVYFDDYVFLDTDKIDNKGTNRILPPEFPASKFPVPQMTPQSPFGIGQALPQGLGELPGQSSNPSPQPSPLAGEREFLLSRLGLLRQRCWRV